MATTWTQIHNTDKKKHSIKKDTKKRQAAERSNNSIRHNTTILFMARNMSQWHVIAQIMTHNV